MNLKANIEADVGKGVNIEVFHRIGDDFYDFMVFQ